MYLMFGYSPFGWNIEGTGINTVVLGKLLCCLTFLSNVKFLPCSECPSKWLIIELNFSWQFWKRTYTDVFGIRLGFLGIYLARNKMFYHVGM